ncbi:hypothetical protein FZEAL_1522 [Fusarium zealandicum]|uniref:Uncharacterized protein n=1 Tax=Fusarium zealandicum TaxID=1053134 RepID=A0A8H4UT95_9HYPO|nr:hypothetical protein FZEAL_1522 [Fusarium zealandicum]
MKGYSDASNNGDVACRVCAIDRNRLAAPVCEQSCTHVRSGDPSRPCIHSQSAYLIDGGLWTACKESRLVMEQQFECQKWDSERRDSIRNHRGWQRFTERMPATGYFATDDPHKHYFTVFPHQDLFLLHYEDLKNTPWNKINWDIPIGSTLRGFGGLRNLALIYNPEWGDQVIKAEPATNELDIVQTLVQAAFDAEYADTIWFIDYSLKRKVMAPTLKQSGRMSRAKTFYASDRRFVEVVSDFGSESFWEHPNTDDESHARSVRFRNALRNHMEDRLHPDDTDQDEWPCDVGALACEYL